MLKSEIFTKRYAGGELQRYEKVTFDSWDQLKNLTTKPDVSALQRFADIYEEYLVPACPWIFGQILMFTCPDDIHMPFSYESTRYGTVSERMTATAIAFRNNISLAGQEPVFRTKETEAFYNLLYERNCVRIVRGRLPFTTVIPVNNQAGYLSQSDGKAKLKVNSAFFIMDCFDCATPYDLVGMPFGLSLSDGEILRPPLFNREALLVSEDGTVSIEIPKLKELTIEIAGRQFRPGENAALFERPKFTHSTGNGTSDLVIIGSKVAAVRQAGNTPVPASGFVLQIQTDCNIKPGDAVRYHGMERFRFGIQVGNSVMRCGRRTERFISPFYNIFKPWSKEFPPSLYPLNYRKSRAARIALGADDGGRPMLVWAEGAAKHGYQRGKDSCGASLSEFAAICEACGMTDGINLDGGGSAQLLIENRRDLKISDRDSVDFGEKERPVPCGLVIKE